MQITRATRTLKVDGGFQAQASVVWKKASSCVALAALTVLAGCGGGGQSLLAIAPTGTVTLDAGQSLPILVSVINDSSMRGATYSLSGVGTLSAATAVPVGSSEQINLTYQSPATVPSPTTTMFTATSVHTPSQTATLTININSALVITTTSLPNGTVNTAYSATLASTGGTGTVKWTLASGTLPTGLTLTTAGLLSGKPSAFGTFTFTLAATDAASTPNVVTQSYTVTILPQPPVITTTSLPNGIVGTAYSQQLMYTGGNGTASFAITAGSLPSSSGLTLSSTGLISGTPSVASAGMTYSFSVAVTVGSQTSAPVALTLTIAALPAVSTTTLPSGNIGIPYSKQLTFTGGNGGAVSWAIVSGSLPAGSGLTLSASGLLSGTPTTATTYSFSVAVTVGGQTSAAQALTLVVNSLIVTSSAAATGEAGLPFSFRLTAAGGTGPYTWSLASGSATLPAPLTLNPTTGLISGTPATAAGSPFTGIVVQATDSLGATATQAMTFTINAARGTSNNSELNGQYAFLLSGFDSNGKPLASAGKFTADAAGHITSGVVDTNGTGLSAATTNVSLTAGTFSVGSDNRGKITLTTASGTTNYVIALNSITGGIAGGGTLTEFDSNGQSLTGLFALQTPSAFTTASITGGYAFGASGFAANSTAIAPQHRSLIGELQSNGAGGISSGELLSSASPTATPTTITSATIAIGANGRGTLSVTLPGSVTVNYAVYVISAAKLFLLTTDPASGTTGTNDLLFGQALQQTTTNGNFNAASLSGISVLRSEKAGKNAAGTYIPDNVLGLYTANGAGALSFSGDENAGGVATTSTLNGTYTVSANGRVALALTASLGGCSDCVSALTYAYLVGANRGFLMDFSNAATSGAFEPQTATGFTAASFSGSYTAGTVRPLTPTAMEISGVATSTGAGTIASTLDFNANGTLVPDAPTTATYVVGANGRVAITQTGSTPIMYIVSATRAFLMDLSSATPVIQEILHQ